MNLNCAILHADPEITGRLEEYIGKVPFLSLHGKYGNPLEALKDYYETKSGSLFCRHLSGGRR